MGENQVMSSGETCIFPDFSEKQVGATVKASGKHVGEFDSFKASREMVGY